MQIDVNKRQTERMARNIQNEIRLDQLVCHPDVNALGISFDENFIFRNQDADAETVITDIYRKKQPEGAR